MAAPWKTRRGYFTVRHDPPTLGEAIAAAQGLTDEVEHQVEIAAALMGAAHDAVRAEIGKMSRQRVAIATPAAHGARAAKPVLVEYKASRRSAARLTGGR